MGIERNENINKEELIEKLRAVIYAESSKPASEMDADLVAECVDYLMELENSRRLTEDEIDSEIQKIITETQKPRKSNPRFKALLIAACMAVIILSFNIFALACGTDAISLLRELGDKVVEMFDGEKIVVDDKETVKLGDVITYDSVEEFLKEENISVLYPTVLPDNAKITSVSLTASFVNGEYNAEYRDIDYITDNATIHVAVYTNPVFNRGFLSDPNAEVKTINNHECYISQIETSAQGFFIHGNNVYVVNAPTCEDVEFIISNLKEGTPQ